MKAKIPITLDETVDYLLANTLEADQDEFAREPEHSPGAKFHFHAGMALRNDLGLWHDESDLCKFLLANGFWHGDDRSSLIFKALWCRFNNKIIDLIAERAHYDAYWARAGLGKLGVPIVGFVAPKRQIIKFNIDGQIEYMDDDFKS